MNYNKAIEWYKKAAEQGHAYAQFKLGYLYHYLGELCHHGVGVDQSDSTAMRWYAKAAAQGDEQAQARIDELLTRRRSSSAAAVSGPSVPGEEEEGKKGKKGKKASGSNKKRK